MKKKKRDYSQCYEWCFVHFMVMLNVDFVNDLLLLYIRDHVRSRTFLGRRWSSSSQVEGQRWLTVCRRSASHSRIIWSLIEDLSLCCPPVLLTMTTYFDDCRMLSQQQQEFSTRFFFVYIHIFFSYIFNLTYYRLFNMLTECLPWTTHWFTNNRIA